MFGKKTKIITSMCILNNKQAILQVNVFSSYFRNLLVLSVRLSLDLSCIIICLKYWYSCATLYCSLFEITILKKNLCLPSRCNLNVFISDHDKKYIPLFRPNLCSAEFSDIIYMVRLFLFKVILCASKHIRSIVRYCFSSFKKIHYMY